MKVISYNGIEKKIDKIAELGGFDPDTQEELKSFIEKAVFDAEPIVRCKNCKWYSQFTSMTGKLLSEGRCEYHSNYFAEDDFCSRGERKNG